MSKIISLYAGPGSGKSVAAAYLYSALASKGLRSELVREYIKKWAWDNRVPGPYDQYYFFGKQTREESMLLGKVDWIVTDSPVWIGAYYAQRYSPPHVKEGVKAVVRSYYNQVREDGHEHINIWVNRYFPYQQAGRFETEIQASSVDQELMGMLKEEGIELLQTTSNSKDLEMLLNTIMEGK